AAGAGSAASVTVAAAAGAPVVATPVAQPVTVRSSARPDQGVSAPYCGSPVYHAPRWHRY
ncbi:MAG: hypothetical protein AB7F78_20335, partial [Hyphomicrobiaceae bacterium]